MEKSDKKYYSLFKGKEVDCYEKSKQARDEQLLAFYLAYKQGVKGYLMNEFKKEFYEEAISKEDELYKEFLTAHESNLPKKINKQVMSIYKEELNF